jgi:hypothetical protein
MRSLPAEDVKQFRTALARALEERDNQGRAWADARWGVYMFRDYDGEPIYTGQTNEQLRVRIRRHLTNQRTDVVAMRILDVMEVAEVEVWPLWQYQDIRPRGTDSSTAREHLNALEYTVWRKAIEASQFGGILNEKAPPERPLVDLPQSHRFELVSPEIRSERGHPDIRIARRADTLARVAAVARERGEVTPGLRRVIVVQALRLAYLSAHRLAYVEGRPTPDPSVLNPEQLVGSLLDAADDDQEVQEVLDADESE